MGSSRWRVYFLLGLTAVETVQALALGCVGLPWPGVYLAAWEVTERVCNRVCGDRSDPPTTETRPLGHGSNRSARLGPQTG